MYKFLLISCVFIPFFGCQNAAKKASEPANGKSCYLAKMNRDSVLLDLNMQGDSASGTLEYRMFGEDHSIGKFTGSKHGDTLMLIYTFQSEGITSETEIAFLRKGDDYIEGHAPMKQDGSRSVFSDKKMLQFDSNIILKNTPCKN